MSQMKSDQLKELLKSLKDGINKIFASPELLERLVERIVPHKPDIRLGEINLFDVLRLVLARLLHMHYHAPKHKNKARGLLLIYLIHFDPVCGGDSVARAFASIAEPRTLESLYELLSDYFRFVQEPMLISKAELAQWLKMMSGADERTAQRHYQTGMMIFANALGEFLDQIVQGEISAPLPGTGYEQAGEMDVRAMVARYALEQISVAPSAFGIKTPLNSCISRQLRIMGDHYFVESTYLANHLAGRSGLILGSPGSGLTTVLRLVVLHGNQSGCGNNSVFLFSAREYVEFAQQGQDGLQFVASKLLGPEYPNQRSRAKFLTQLDDLNRNRQLLLLVDDLDKLPYPSQQLVLSMLRTFRSIYFSVAPWEAEMIIRSMTRYGYGEEFLHLKLTDLTNMDKEMLRSLASNLTSTNCFARTDVMYVHDANFESAKTPLAVLAALHSQSSQPIEPLARNISFALDLLSEFLRRGGYSEPQLTERWVDLKGPIVQLIQIGNALHCLLFSGSFDSTYDDNPNRSGIWIPLEHIREFTNISLDDLLQLRVFEINSETAQIRFISADLEELLVTLYCYYFGQCGRTLWDYSLSGISAHILSLARKGAQYIPSLCNHQK